MDVHPVEGELFPADRRKDMTKLIVAFRNTVDAPKITSESQNKHGISIRRPNGKCC
jgi:hypothetical protein